MTLLNKIITGTLIAILIIATISVIYLVVIHNPGQDYTEFYILDDNNNTTNIPTNVTQNSIHKIVVGITNQEHQDMNYTVKISKDDIILTKYNQSLQDKENREIPYYMTSTHNKGQNQLIKFELFKNNDTSPYRTLNLRYNVI